MSDGIEKQHEEARRGILGRILAEPTEQIRRSIKEVEDATNRHIGFANSRVANLAH